MPLFVLCAVGCIRDPEPDSGGPAADTADSAAGPADTGQSEDSADTSGGTGDTAVDPSVFSAAVTFGSTAFQLDCTSASGSAFVHTYDDALGNVSGRVICADGTNGEVQITFTTGVAGMWSDPTAGVDFRWTGASGERLGYFEADLTTVAWNIEFATFQRLDTRTIQLSATFSGAWNTPAGTVAGTIAGSADAILSCTNCP